MRRLLFYIIRALAFCCRAISNRLYMILIVKAHKLIGVKFDGFPAYIDISAHIDPSGGLLIGKDCVLSVNVIVLTHDWSFLTRAKAQNISEVLLDEQDLSGKAHASVSIADYTFIGAGAIILPGSTIGKYCIIGAGAVIKGDIPDYSIMIGNPSQKIGDTRDIKHKK